MVLLLLLLQKPHLNQLRHFQKLLFQLGFLTVELGNRLDVSLTKSENLILILLVDLPHTSHILFFFQNLPSIEKPIFIKGLIPSLLKQEMDHDKRFLAILDC